VGLLPQKTAEHHEIHLKEYIAIEKLPLNITVLKLKAKCKLSLYGGHGRAYGSGT
jgi:hypothetical protein